VLHRTGGYVQSIDHRGLIGVAKDADVVIELAAKAGRHIISGSIFAWVDPPDAATGKLRDKVESCLLLESQWESLEDHETSIRQLVEVALRALSPSINDPYTAMAVVDRMTESLAKVMRRHPPQCVWADDDGAVRLLAPASTFADTVEEAYRQIRQHAHGQPAVLIRIVENLGQLLVQADDEQRPVLRQQIEIVLETGRRNIEQEGGSGSAGDEGPPGARGRAASESHWTALTESGTTERPGERLAPAPRGTEGSSASCIGGLHD
jgi:uncharacterized membrane protein